jgi:hypothetical protein
MGMVATTSSSMLRSGKRRRRNSTGAAIHSGNSIRWCRRNALIAAPFAGTVRRASQSELRPMAKRTKAATEASQTKPGPSYWLFKTEF